MTNPRDQQNKDNNQRSGTSNRGFASMPHEKVQEIASKGGHASADKAGHEGMSQRGQMGGRARAEQLGHEGYVELGHRGGTAPHDSRPGRSKSGDEYRNRQQTRGSSSSSTSGSSNRGFASMSKDKVRDIASKGGKSSSSGSNRSSSSRDEEE